MEIWDQAAHDDPSFILRASVIRSLEGFGDRAIGRVMVSLLHNYTDGCALPDIDPQLMDYAPIAVPHMEYVTLAGALDRLCWHYEQQRHQPIHCGMRWTQAGGIGAPQFYLHTGYSHTCPMCRPRKHTPRYDRHDYVMIARDEVERWT